MGFFWKTPPTVSLIRPLFKLRPQNGASCLWAQEPKQPTDWVWLGMSCRPDVGSIIHCRHYHQMLLTRLLHLTCSTHSSWFGSRRGVFQILCNFGRDLNFVLSTLLRFVLAKSLQGVSPVFPGHSMWSTSDSDAGSCLDEIVGKFVSTTTSGRSCCWRGPAKISAGCEPLPASNCTYCPCPANSFLCGCQLSDDYYRQCSQLLVVDSMKCQQRRRHAEGRIRDNHDAQIEAVVKRARREWSGKQRACCQMWYARQPLQSLMSALKEHPDV